MYRDAVVAIAVGLAAAVFTAGPSFAFGHGGGGHAGPAMTGVTPAVSHYSARPGGAPVPLVRKLSGRGVVKCIRACMHGVDAGWAGFCEYSCAGP